MNKEAFEKAVKDSKTLKSKPSNDILLKLYSLYKQTEMFLVKDQAALILKVRLSSMPGKNKKVKVMMTLHRNTLIWLINYLQNNILATSN